MMRICKATIGHNRSCSWVVVLSMYILVLSGCSTQVQGLETIFHQPESTPWKDELETEPAEEAFPTETTPRRTMEPARFIDECPVDAGLGNRKTWLTGSILFARPRESGSSLPDIIFAFNLKLETLNEIASVPLEYFPWPALLSPDGSNLYLGNNWEEPYELRKIDLISGFEVEVFPINTRWSSFSRWGQTDSTVQLERFIEVNDGEIVIGLIIVNTQSGTIDESAYQITLPSFRSAELRPAESFFAISPDRSLVIYTADTKEDPGAVELLLYSFDESERRWMHDLAYSVPLPVPAWTPESDKVAISFFTDQGGSDYDIFILDTEGGLEELVDRVPGEGPSTWVNFLSWSPDERYIYFELGDYPLIGGNGFVVDTISRTMQPICNDLEMQSTNGTWVPNLPHVLVFSQIGDNDLETFNILDVGSWQYRTIDSVSAGGYGASQYRFIGYTESINGLP